MIFERKPYALEVRIGTSLDAYIRPPSPNIPANLLVFNAKRLDAGFQRYLAVFSGAIRVSPWV